MIGKLGPMELVVILVIAILIFGPSRIPKLASAVGDTLRAFKKATSDASDVKREIEDSADHLRRS